MSLHSMNVVAGEDLTACRVVTTRATAEGSVACFMCENDEDVPVGITPEGSLYAPGLPGTTETLVATEGQHVDIRGRGHTVLCEVGTGGCVAGKRVRVIDGTDGKVRGLVGDENTGWTVGVARKTGDSGDFVPVYIDPLPMATPYS